MTRTFRTLALALLVSAAAPARAQLTTTTMAVSIPATIDYWQYENASDPLGRTLAPTWVLPPGLGIRRHGKNVFVFDMPPSIPNVVGVTAAKLRFHDIPQAVWQPTGVATTDGIPSRIELYAAGFGPGYDEATWNGTQPLMPGPEADPYPRDLALDTNVEDVLTTSTPWSVGAPIGYTPGGMSQAFPIECDFDLGNATVAQELLDDARNGRSSWILSSTYEIDFIGDPGTLPNCINTEGVAFFPGSAPPTLELELIVEVFNSAEHWTRYD